MSKEWEGALWVLRERCCCEPEDFEAIDLIETELRKIKDAWFTGDPDNVEDALIELFGDIPLK